VIVPSLVQVRNCIDEWTRLQPRLKAREIGQYLQRHINGIASNVKGFIMQWLMNVADEMYDEFQGLLFLRSRKRLGLNSRRLQSI
jgi:hypothetical protein